MDAISGVIVGFFVLLSAYIIYKGLTKKGK